LDEVQGITTGPMSELCVTGYFSGHVDFGDELVSTGGYRSLHITRFHL
jgi:hypothetical protein